MTGYQPILIDHWEDQSTTICSPREHPLSVPSAGERTPTPSPAIHYSWRQWMETSLLAPDSPAASIGFKNFSMDDFGVPVLDSDVRLSTTYADPVLAEASGHEPHHASCLG